MKVIAGVTDFVFLVLELFFTSAFGLLVKFYWLAILIIALIFFAGYHKVEWLSLFYGVGAVLACAGILSALVTILILLGVASVRYSG